MDPGLRDWYSRGRFLTFDGHEVFYVDEGSGPALLLIHGYPFSSWDWIQIWGHLTARFRVIAPDMLGMGFSAKPVDYAYRVAAHADMHTALLAELGVGRCHVIAHDIGVSVAQELLTRQFEGTTRTEIASIAFLNGGLFHEVYRPRLVQTLLSDTIVGSIVGRFPFLMTDRLTDLALDEMFGPETKPSKELLRQWHEILAYHHGKRVSHLVGRFIHDRKQERDRWVTAMQRTSVPLRFIDGPCDPNSGAHMAARYREIIPNPDVVSLGDTIGHWPQLEDPAGVIRHFDEFIDRLPPG
ncbi:alpha/beta fold hydrolase [Nocardia sp. NPDC049149]|uniref:alpha/beta fold hydrolase n=1 Tax=Nocardia sp. NPDC049149 TaxID=3364315 RepID=UPI00371FFE5A